MLCLSLWILFVCLDQGGAEFSHLYNNVLTLPWCLARSICDDTPFLGSELPGSVNCLVTIAWCVFFERLGRSHQLSPQHAEVQHLAGQLPPQPPQQVVQTAMHDIQVQDSCRRTADKQQW